MDDGLNRVGDGFGLKRGLIGARPRSEVVTELCVSEKARATFRVVNDRDLEERPSRLDHRLEKVGDEGEVVDDRWVDAASGVPDDRRVTEFEPEKVGRIRSLVQTRDDADPRSRLGGTALVRSAC
jgi:hypothetical protein